MVLYTEAQLKKAYDIFIKSLNYLTEDGFDMGQKPDLEEFRIIFEEEHEAQANEQ